MADQTLQYSLNLDVVLEPLNRGEIQKALRAFESQLGTVLSQLKSPTVQQDVAVDLTLNSATSQKKLSDALNASIEHVFSNPKMTARGAEEYKAFLGNLAKSLDIVGRNFDPKLVSVYDQLKEQDRRAFSKLKKAQQEQVRQYAEMRKAQARLFQQVSSRAVRIDTATGEDTTPMKPLVDPVFQNLVTTLQAEARTVGRMLDRVPSAKQRAARLHAIKVTKAWREFSSPKPGKESVPLPDDFSFSALDRAYRTLLRDAQRNQADTTNLGKKQSLQRFIDFLDTSRGEAKALSNQLTGRGALTQSLDEVRMEAKRQEAAFEVTRTKLKEALQGGAGDTTVTALQKRAIKHLSTARTKRYQEFQKVLAEMGVTETSDLLKALKDDTLNADITRVDSLLSSFQKEVAQQTVAQRDTRRRETAAPKAAQALAEVKQRLEQLKGLQKGTAEFDKLQSRLKDAARIYSAEARRSGDDPLAASDLMVEAGYATREEVAARELQKAERRARAVSRAFDKAQATYLSQVPGSEAATGTRNRLLDLAARYKPLAKQLGKTSRADTDLMQRLSVALARQKDSGIKAADVQRGTLASRFDEQLKALEDLEPRTPAYQSKVLELQELARQYAAAARTAKAKDARNLGLELRQKGIANVSKAAADRLTQAAAQAAKAKTDFEARIVALAGLDPKSVDYATLKAELADLNALYQSKTVAAGGVKPTDLRSKLLALPLTQREEEARARRQLQRAEFSRSAGILRAWRGSQGGQALPEGITLREVQTSLADVIGALTQRRKATPSASGKERLDKSIRALQAELESVKETARSFDRQGRLKGTLAEARKASAAAVEEATKLQSELRAALEQMDPDQVKVRALQDATQRLLGVAVSRKQAELLGTAQQKGETSGLRDELTRLAQQRDQFAGEAQAQRTQEKQVSSVPRRLRLEKAARDAAEELATLVFGTPEFEAALKRARRRNQAYVRAELQAGASEAPSTFETLIDKNRRAAQQRKEQSDTAAVQATIRSTLQKYQDPTRAFAGAGTPAQQINQVEVARAQLSRQFQPALRLGMDAEAEKIKQLGRELRALQRDLEAQLKASDPAEIAREQERQVARGSGRVQRIQGGRAYQRVGGRVDRLHEEEYEPTRDYLDAKIAATKLRIERMGLTAGPAREKLNKELVELQKNRRILQQEIVGNVGLMREISVAINSFVRYAAVYGGLYQLAGAFSQVARNVVALQDALKGIQTIAQATDGQMVKLAATIRSVASNSPFTLEQVAASAQTLAQAGVEISKIPGALRAITNMALATGSDVQTAADVATSAQMIFPQKTYTQISDQLSGAVNVSKLSPTDLQTIFNLAAQTAQTSGISQEQLLGASATLRNLGIKGSTIATGLRELILEIFNPDPRTMEFLKRRYAAIGESFMNEAMIQTTFRGFQRTDNPLASAFAELRRLGVTGAARDEFRRIYETRAENVALPLIERPEAFASNVASISQVGAASEGARTRIDSLASALRILGNEINSTADILSEDLVKSLQHTTETLTGLFKRLRDEIDNRRLRGESVTPSILAPVAAGVGAALMAPVKSMAKLAVGIGTAAVAGVGSLGAEGLGKTVAAATDWLMTIFGLIQIFKLPIFARSTKSLEAVADAGAAAGKVAAASKGLQKLLGTMPGVLKAMTTLSSWGELAASQLGKIVSLVPFFGKLNPWGALLAGMSLAWEAFSALRTAAPEEQLNALRRKVADLEGEAKTVTDSFSAYDPQSSESLTTQVAKAKDAVERYQAQLAKIFGEASSEKVDQILRGLGEKGLEAATEEAKAAKDKLEKEVLNRSLTEREFSALIKAYTDMKQAEGTIVGQSRSILDRVIRLYQKPRDALTDEERALLKAYETASDPNTFNGVATSAKGLVDRSKSLLDVLNNVFNQNSGDLEAERERAARTLGRVELQSDVQSPRGMDSREATIRALLSSPTPENRDKLKAMRQDLSNLLRPGVTNDPTERANYQQLFDMIERAWQGYLDQVIALEQQARNRTQEETQAREATQERLRALDVEEVEIRRRRMELIQQSETLHQQNLKNEEKILKAQETNDIPAITRRGGLLDERYRLQKGKLEVDTAEANLEYRRRATEAGLTPALGVNASPEDLTAIYGTGNEKVADAYEKWVEARRKEEELRNDIEKQRQQFTRSMRPDAYEMSPQAEENARKARAIEEQLSDDRRETEIEVQRLFNEWKALRLAVYQDEIDHLKRNQSKYGPDQPRYQRDLDRLEQQRDEEAKNIEKRRNEVLHRLRDEEYRLKRQELERRYRAIEKQIAQTGQVPNTIMRGTQTLQPGVPMAVGAGSSLQEKAQYAMAYFMRELGLTKEQAAGLVGNLIHESKLNPQSENRTYGTLGIAQWRLERRDLLRSKPNYKDFNTQLAYVVEEYKTSKRAALRALRDQTSVESSADTVRTTFEIPNENMPEDAAVEKRRQRAREAYSGRSDTISPLQMELQDIIKQIAELDRQNADRSGNRDAAIAASVEDQVSRIQDSLTKSAEAIVSQARNYVKNQQVALERVTSSGIPYGPEGTAARQAANMPASPTAELARLQASEAALVRVSDEITLQSESITSSLASAKDELAKVEDEIASGRLSGDQLDLAKGTQTGLQNQVELYSALLLEFSRDLNEARAALGANRQEQQTYAPTFRGKNGAFGQFEQATDLDALAGDLNKLSYAFNKLGANIREFTVNAINTFITTIAEQLVNGAKEVDTTALQQAQAELRDAQAEAAYQKATKTAEIQRLDRNARLGGADSGLDKQRRDELQQALNESLAAQNERARAAAEAVKAQQEQINQASNPLGQAFEGLAKEGISTLLKTAMLSPIQGLLGMFGMGKRDGSSEGSALFVQVVGDPLSKAAGTAGELVGGSGLLDFLDKVGNSSSQAWDSAASWLSTIGSFFFSKGGPVRGPGSGTSDSIPAMLSNGEYVLTAREVAAIGPQNLQAWKAAMMSPARFATGGMVSSFDRVNSGLANSSNSPSGDSGTVVNIIDQRSNQAAPVEVSRSQGPDNKELIQVMVRDAVRTAINTGQMDRTMMGNYGARRIGGKR